MGPPPPLSKTTAVLLLLFLLAAEPSPSAAKLSTYTDSYGPFNNTLYYSSILQFASPATISNNALQITPDSISADFKLSNLSGRVLLNRPFKLWQNRNPKSVIASFNSSFLVNLYQVNNSVNLPGEGLTFLLSPDLSLPPNSYGQYLGLTNSTTDGLVSNQILAVELDTFKNDFDPDANHVGLNINSARSNITASLTPLGFELCPKNKANFFVVWVEYDGVEKVIDVYITQQENKTGPTPGRPASPVLRSNIDLRTVVNQFSYFGFSASTGDATQLNCVLGWNLTVQYFSENNNSTATAALAVVLSVAVLGLVLGVGLFYYRKKTRPMRTRSNLVGALKSLPGTPREFEFKELKKATSNFDEKNKLGEGAYGVVYRGSIPKEDLEVAVKWFLRENIKGEDDFLAELTIINRLRHKNLVRLLGWCHKNGKLLLVYDYMPNGSLDQHLFAGADAKPLCWGSRYKIISGVASALHYLHNEYDQKVVHRDLKASNILLDNNFNARLGDFGLARALENEKTSYAEVEGVLGTMGYIALECFHTGRATQQSDIYAFGAVLLEVVCGQRPGAKVGGYHCLVDWVWSLHRDGKLLDAVDSRIGDDYVADEAERVLLLGLACSHPTAGERPKTEAVVQMISGSVEVPRVPHFKPAFIWPSMPMMDDNSSQATITETRSISTSEWTPRRDGYADYSDNFNLV